MHTIKKIVLATAFGLIISGCDDTSMYFVLDDATTNTTSSVQHE